MKKTMIFLFLAIVLGMFSSVWADDIIIGTGTSTGAYPMNTNWGYSRNASLYTAAEVTTTGTIQALAWYVSSATTANIPVKIYLKHTALTSLTADTWANLTSGATLVYDATTQFTPAGWKTFTLTTPFSYTGGSNNLLVLVEANYGGGGAGSTVNFRYTSASGKVLYKNVDTTPPTTALSTSSNRANITITFPSLNPPNPANTPSPATLATDVAKSPTLTWVSGGGGPTSYDVYFGTNPSPAFIGNQAGLSYSPGSLNYNQTYYWQIIPRNANGPATGCPVWSFTTLADPTIVSFPYAQSFEGAVYPPLGWTHTLGGGATTGFQRVTTAQTNPAVATAFDGTAFLYFNSYNIAVGGYAALATPPIDCTGSTYNYRVRFAFWRDSSNYPGDIDKIEVYTNTTQDLTGATLIGTVNRYKTLAPAETGADGWYQYTYDIGVGSKTIKYVIFKMVSAYGNNMDFDKVEILKESAENPPNAPISLNPANAATNVAINTNLTWSNGGGSPTGYMVFFGTDPESLERIGDQPELVFDPADNLLYNTTYYWYITAYNDFGSSDSAVQSFTTANGQPVITSPANAATNVLANMRTLDWADVAGATGYRVRIGTTPGGSEFWSGFDCATSTYIKDSNWPYGVTIYWQVTVLNGSQEIVGPEWSFSVQADPTLIAPTIQDFATFPPTNWTRWSGTLAAPTTLTTTTSGWIADGFGNVGSTGAAGYNIYSTNRNYWLMTPPINLGSAAYALEFDLALTAYNSTNAAATTGVDDKFAVVISTDGGTTWTSANTLRLWDNAGSPNVYNSISTAGEHISIDLTPYSGIVMIGFYGESTVSNADNDVFIDNFAINGLGVPPTAPTTCTPANSATGIAINTNLAWGGATGVPTGYQVFFGTDSESLERIADVPVSPYVSEGNLLFNTTYYWYVTAYNDFGATDGSIWSFTTANGIPSTPVPAIAATGINGSARTLDWADVAGASGYKVVIGTSSGASNILNMGVTATSSYTMPVNWSYNTTYYWKVYTVNGTQEVEGPEWNFTTGADPTITAFPTLISLTGHVGTGLPFGWTQESSAGVNALWSVVSTASAGVASPEFQCHYQQIMGSARLISPPIRVTNLSAIIVKFSHFWDYYAAGISGKLQYSTDLTTWTDAWTLIDPTENVGPAEVSAYITFPATQDLYISWIEEGNLYNNDNWWIDNIKFLVPASDVTETTVVGGSVTAPMPTITNPITNDPINTTVELSNLPGASVIEIGVSYAPADIVMPNAGLAIDLQGANFGGAHVVITHNLGFVPEQLAYRVLPSGWHIVTNTGSWTTTVADFDVPAGKAAGDVEVVFPRAEGQTLPVELSSFTATTTATYFVQLAWIVQSETNHQGYNVLRSNNRELNDAVRVNSDLISEGINVGSEIHYSFTDQEVENNSNYFYWLEDVALNGETEFFGPLMVSLGNPSGENPVPEIPTVTALMGAYPNPFNPQTTIRYSVKDAGSVNIDIFNSKGQLVKSFKENPSKAGNYSVTWNGKDANGSRLSSGMYFYRMTSGSYTASKKMVLLK